MRTSVLLVLFISMAIAVNAYHTEYHNGRPGCETDMEMSQRLWRNNFDPTKYFICEIRFQPGEEVSCEGELLFDPTAMKCVYYTNWQWIEPVDPPTLG